MALLISRFECGFAERFCFAIRLCILSCARLKLYLHWGSGASVLRAVGTRRIENLRFVPRAGRQVTGTRRAAFRRSICISLQLIGRSHPQISVYVNTENVIHILTIDEFIYFAQYDQILCHVYSHSIAVLIYIMNTKFTYVPICSGFLGRVFVIKVACGPSRSSAMIDTLNTNKRTYTSCIDNYQSLIFLPSNQPSRVK